MNRPPLHLSIIGPCGRLRVELKPTATVSSIAGHYLAYFGLPLFECRIKFLGRILDEDDGNLDEIGVANGDTFSIEINLSNRDDIRTRY